MKTTEKMNKSETWIFKEPDKIGKLIKTKTGNTKFIIIRNKKGYSPRDSTDRKEIIRNHYEDHSQQFCNLDECFLERQK